MPFTDKRVVLSVNKDVQTSALEVESVSSATLNGAPIDFAADLQMYGYNTGCSTDGVNVTLRLVKNYFTDDLDSKLIVLAFFAADQAIDFASRVRALDAKNAFYLTFIQKKVGF